MIHELSPLPFNVDALEPALSSQTLELHYGKHYRGYVTKLNSLTPGTEFENMSLTEVVRKSAGPIFNNAGQAWNHEFYWQSLSPQKKRPHNSLLRAIEKNFLSLDRFQTDFQREAESVFGSGWAWLVMDGSGHLMIETTSNAENPLRRGKVPLLNLDVWEHAYSLDYQNERARYLRATTAHLNWDFADFNFGTSELSLAV